MPESATPIRHRPPSRRSSHTLSRHSGSPLLASTTQVLTHFPTPSTTRSHPAQVSPCSARQFPLLSSSTSPRIHPTPPPQLPPRAPPHPPPPPPPAAPPRWPPSSLGTGAPQISDRRSECG